MISPPELENPAVPQAPAAPRAAGRSRGRRRSLLGIAWLGPSLDAAVFAGSSIQARWTAPAPVGSIEEFAAVLPEMLAALEFPGTETLLLLEHDQFIHRAEAAPSASESVARTYLRARVARHERECGEPVWCAQRMASARQDASFMLHLLPAAFFEHLNQVLAARGLDLARIHPLAVPLQLEIDELAAASEQPVLVAAEISGMTAILVGRSGNRPAFSRTIRASWADEPVRVGVEVNRSLLYAKQQLGTSVDRIRLLGRGPAVDAVRARCGGGREIQAEDPRPVAWLQAVARLAPGDPMNLVAGHLQGKRRKRLLRSGMAAACWLGLASLAVTIWSDQTVRRGERERFAAISARETVLRGDYGRLLLRDAAMRGEREFIQEAADRRLPPVPGRTLAYIAGLLPKGLRLSEFQVDWDSSASRWTFQAAGTIEGDEESSHAALENLQQQLERSPIQARFTEPPRTLTALPSPSNGPELFGFSMGGTLFEN